MLRRIGEHHRPAEQRHWRLVDKLAADLLIPAGRRLQQGGMFQNAGHQLMAEDVMRVGEFGIGRRAARYAAQCAHLGKMRERIVAERKRIEERSRHAAAGSHVIS
ncbi:MAG: hypothetical protein E5Y89_07330 [Mesorhizobium sp.]|nr:MAG: hypothetical protein E5Y89_07330 [Mesorhizobium sp.]TIW46129.1 MAG: hypothetical protein E5V61_12540 [Mesorhizobium sp.]TIW66551.1 MAG: hypothetical protein E5V60_12040 [Mesorhizobium sp.]TIX09143.1 MAG: hypothetical protein E5V46_23660 [Mesorhizobium sp.]